MTRKDLWAGLGIGTAVGILIQPIFANNISAHDLAYLTLPARLGLVIFFAVLAPFALWIAKFLSRWAAGLYQFAQFAAVGTLNSFIDVGVFNVETFLYGSSLISNGLFALFKAISFVFATTNSFVWNKYWTFGSSDKTNAKEITGFYGVALVGWAANVLVATLVKAFGPVDSRVWVNIVAPLAGIAAAFAWNFIGFKYWVFKKKAE